jgi:hypothetical protein
MSNRRKYFDKAYISNDSAKQLVGPVTYGLDPILGRPGFVAVNNKTIKVRITEKVLNNLTELSSNTPKALNKMVKVVNNTAIVMNDSKED